MVNQFFQGFQDVAANPTDQDVARGPQRRRQRAGTFQGLWSRVDQLKTDLTTEITSRWGRPTG